MNPAYVGALAQTGGELELIVALTGPTLQAKLFTFLWGPFTQDMLSQVRHIFFCRNPFASWLIFESYVVASTHHCRRETGHRGKQAAGPAILLHQLGQYHQHRFAAMEWHAGQLGLRATEWNLSHLR